MATSLSSAVRLFTPKPLSFFSKPIANPSNLSFSSPISFQRIKTKAQIQPQDQLSLSNASSPSLNLSLLPPKLVEIISLFQSVPDPKTRYQQLLHYGTQLPPLDSHFKTDANRVQGCVSQVWVRAFKDPQEGDNGADPVVRFEADSDSQLTKGIAALLVFGLSGSPVSSIVRLTPDFIDLLGIRQSLSPSRNSGMLNMLKLMQRKALELAIQENSGNFDDPGSKDLISGTKSDEIEGKLDNKEVNSNGKDVNLDGIEGTDVVSSFNGGDASVHIEEKLASSSGEFGGRKERIRDKLEKKLSPVELNIEDVSHLHKGHAAMIGNNSNGETHFNVRIVSKEFEGKSLVKRHRLVYDSLKEELNSGLHALSIDAKTPSEV
ncbi:sufE-like protein [Carex littledalei]|uniref:SufE-like protein n=1 Tax=Carex littledalei TaxID=544730 RepID=A0A833QMY1_9POAL|nr:sufE-like protein [Carex littledalei]